MKLFKKHLRKIFFILAAIFVFINFIAYNHAYKFTHFSEDNVIRTKDPKELSITEKISVLIMGIDNPKPKHTSYPSQEFETIKLTSAETIECWYIKIPDSRGTVILFHGYSGEKSSLLSRSDEFLKLGFNTFLVDFMGSGGSTGNQTTLGYKEAEQVKACYDQVRSKGEQNIFLFGTSMGAAAILKAFHDYTMNASGIILECPFGSLYKTICARFEIMGIPSFPMAGILSFWGGVQNNFWPFSHNPSVYAKSVSCPTLLLYGENDNRVSHKEIDDIFNNLKGEKNLKTYSEVGHAIFTPEMQSIWINDVSSFINDLDRL